MWQTKYALAIPKNLGLGFNLRPRSEGYFVSGRPYSPLPKGIEDVEFDHSFIFAMPRKVFN